MRVTLDVSAVPARPAGAGRYVLEVARRLPGAGVSTTLVTRRDDARRWREWVPDASIAPLVPTGRLTRLAYEAWVVGATPPARGADVWHAPHYTMPHRGATPAVVTIHDLTFFTHPEWHEPSKVAFFRRAIRYAARHAAVLVCVSEYTARELDALVPDHAPLVVAPLGVDLAHFTPVDVGDDAALGAAGLAPHAPYVLFVGTVEPRKGLDVLVDAFAALASEHPTLELWLAGQEGWGVAAWRERLAHHPAASRVRHLGYVAEEVLPALMRRARAVAYPSRGEGFGLPVLEALACGALVVTSRDTVMAEVAGDAATLVTPGDALALADALDAVLRATPTRRAIAAARARERAEHFTWDAMMERHLAAYARAAGA